MWWSESIDNACSYAIRGYMRLCVFMARRNLLFKIQWG